MPKSTPELMIKAENNIQKLLVLIFENTIEAYSKVLEIAE
jgi:hypothetical protein